MSGREKLKFLEDRWDEQVAAGLDAPELLRYRSNLLGADLRLTNFSGGNTSSKVTQADPLGAGEVTVLWVKGSGGDLGSIERAGFATLYLDKLLALERSYAGVAREDEMAALYPLCTFGNNPTVASIDTPLHGYLPFAHVDHLHPDWGIALAASANGLEKMAEFNREFGHRLAWLPWQRPGFELGLMLRRAVEQTPGCDGVVLGGHGLFTWGETQRESYLATITIVDRMGQFIDAHAGRKKHVSFGGARFREHAERARIAAALMPAIRGRVSAGQRVIGSFSDAPEVLAFVNAHSAEKLAQMGTSCPDHFIRTKIRPLFVDWDPATEESGLVAKLEDVLESYRAEYAAYYRRHALADSPAMRDASPAVVLVPGLGQFSFGKNKMESRVTGEFYTNAIHVMQGAGAMDESRCPPELPQAGPAAGTSAFSTHGNYVALPPSEAFRIEYWALEEAKIRRQPPEKELSRRIVLVVGGGSGIGREVVLLAAARGAHVVVADGDEAAAGSVAEEARGIAGKEAAVAVRIETQDRAAIRAALDATIMAFGGLDLLISTAAMMPDSQSGPTLESDVAANTMLAEEAAQLFARQGLPVSIVLTSPANEVAAERKSAAYEGSKAALRDLVRELAAAYAPRVRVNGMNPAMVAKDSPMFTPVAARECAEAILFLAGPKTRMTGHVIAMEGVPAMSAAGSYL